MSKTILLGTDGTTVYTLTFDGEELSYNEYKEVFTYDEGEEKAQEYLENDTYLWKEAVASDSTTASLEEWAEDVINIDGWRHVLGDDNIIDLDDTETYFVEEYNHEEGIGLPFDDPSYFTLSIEEQDFNKLKKGIETDDSKLFEEVFAKYEEFEAKQLEGKI